MGFVLEFLAELFFETIGEGIIGFFKTEFNSRTSKVLIALFIVAFIASFILTVLGIVKNNLGLVIPAAALLVLFIIAAVIWKVKSKKHK